MKALFIIAQQGYQPIEYATPKNILENAGVEVVTASKKTGMCTSGTGESTEAAVSIDNLDISHYDAIVFIGGPGAVQYQHDSEAHTIAKKAVDNGKILAAICIAPTTLAYSGVLQGKKATVWNGDRQQEDVLTDNGATFTDEAVTVDGNIITANGPAAAEEFGQEILKVLRTR